MQFACHAPGMRRSGMIARCCNAYPARVQDM